MLPNPRFASGGDCLKIWDGSNSVFEYRPKLSRKIEGISWSNDGLCIASTLTEYDKILLTYTKPSVPTTVEVATTLGVQPLKVQFSRTSNNCLIVGAKSAVFLYDLNKQKSRKEFRLQSDTSLTSLSTSCNDTHIAAGCSTGQIYLLSCMTGLVGPPLKSSKLDSVTSVKYSNIRQSVLASCGESGHVALWDCNTNRLVCLFHEHKAPATGIAFSQVNEVLFLSSGLDKRCLCYDTNSKRPASTVRTDYPLSSVDYFADGYTLALGTTNGKVLVYDLRSFKSPVSVLSGHSGNVKFVQYQPPINERTPIGSVTKSSNSSKLSTQVSLKNLAQSIKENFPTISETPTTSFQSTTEFKLVEVSTSPLNNGALGRKESLGSQIFSPIRDVGDFGSPLLENKLKANSALSTSRVSHGSVFSPLRENSSNLSHSGETPKSSVQAESLSIFKVNTNLATSSPNNIVIQSDSSISSWLEKKNKTASPLAREPVEPINFQIDDIDSVQNEPTKLTETSPSKYLSVPSPPKKRRSSISIEGKSYSDIKNLLTAFPAAMDNVCPDKTTESRPALKNKEPPVIDGQRFQDDYLKSVVSDQMEEFCSDMRKHLWHIQYDMIRNFQDQHSELKSFRDLYEMNKELASEVERLREENETLKQSPFLTAFDINIET